MKQLPFVKQLLLTTKVGHFFLTSRDKLNLVITALTNEEGLATLSNDTLATKLVTKICLPSKTFIDVGSHIGSIISEVQVHSRSISIVGIEAIPEKIANLRRCFPAVEFFECALGNDSGEINFYVNEKESGYSSLLKPEKDSKKSNTREIVVPIKRLDDISKFENVDVIKIDVEGAELDVILGGKDTIVNNKPIIMFESAPGETLVKEKLWNIFNSLEYGIHLPNRLAHEDHPMSIESFVDSHRYPRLATNYFAVPFDRRIEYRDRARKILNIEAMPNNCNLTNIA